MNASVANQSKTRVLPAKVKREKKISQEGIREN